MKRARNLVFTGILFLVIQPDLNAQQSGIQSRWHGEGIRQVTIWDYQQEDNIFYLISNNLDHLFVNLVIPSTA